MTAAVEFENSLKCLQRRGYGYWIGLANTRRGGCGCVLDCITSKRRLLVASPQSLYCREEGRERNMRESEFKQYYWVVGLDVGYGKTGKMGHTD